MNLGWINKKSTNSGLTYKENLISLGEDVPEKMAYYRDDIGLMHAGSGSCPFCGCGAVEDTVYQNGRDAHCSGCGATWAFSPVHDCWTWRK